MEFRSSPRFYFVIGTLWFVTAVITCLENPIFIGSIFWPPIIFGIAGLLFYTRGIILLIKDHHRDHDHE